jgi:3alpha(or 20beta)-hydroxysteroid dehydrogenase
MGEAEVRLFAAEGATVVVGDVLVAEGKALARELGQCARFFELDVSEEAAWERAVSKTSDEFGGIDVLVNNAGIALFAPIASMSTEDYMRVFAVNQLGVFFGMRAVIPAMTARLGGSIVNISSIDGIAGNTTGTAYVSSKFAVRGMTKVAALELASVGIRVNSIHPGVVDTPMTGIAAPGVDIAAVCSPHIPMRRLGRPEEIARLALFLASEESSYCTGSEFVADGGVMSGHMLEPGPDLLPALGAS